MVSYIDVYAINNGVVLTNLSLGGYFHVTMSDTLDTYNRRFSHDKRDIFRGWRSHY